MRRVDCHGHPIDYETGQVRDQPDMFPGRGRARRLRRDYRDAIDELVDAYAKLGKAGATLYCTPDQISRLRRDLHLHDGVPLAYRGHAVAKAPDPSP